MIKSGGTMFPHLHVILKITRHFICIHLRPLSLKGFTCNPLRKKNESRSSNQLIYNGGLYKGRTVFARK